MVGAGNSFGIECLTCRGRTTWRRPWAGTNGLWRDWPQPGPARIRVQTVEAMLGGEGKELLQACVNHPS